MLRGNVRKLNDGRGVYSLNASIHNRFDIEVRDAKTNEVQQQAKAYNVVCSNLWNNLSSYFGYIAYGDGTGTPSASDKSLFGNRYYAGASDHSTNVDLPAGVASRTKKIILDETTSVGVTITEVGLSSNNASGYLCTHAMLQDMNGNPISITKTETDIITIYATVYVHWNPSGYFNNKIYLGSPCQPNGSSSINNFIDQLLGYGFSTSTGGYSPDYAYSYVGKGTGKMSSFGSAPGRSYSSADKSMVLTFPRMPVESGNLTGGFGWVALMYLYRYNGSSSYTCDVHCVIDVRGEYTVVDEAVGTGDGETTEFATLFDLPTNAVVYIDGVAQTSGVTVKKEPVCSDPFRYLLRIEDTLYEGQPIVTAGPLTVNTTVPVYFYNPLCEFGLYTWSPPDSSSWPGVKIAFSDDFVNWSGYYRYNSIVPEEYRYRKYIRMLTVGTSTWPTHSEDVTGSFPPEITGKNIVFDTAPAVGSVITIDYTTPFVPKDSNHVYDLSMAVQFGEYTEG